MIAHATTFESCRPMSPDERLAQWASRYYGEGHYRAQANCDSEDETTQAYEPKDIQ